MKSAGPEKSTDKEAEMFDAVKNRCADRYIPGTFDLLKSSNRPLYDKIFSLEDSILRDLAFKVRDARFNKAIVTKIDDYERALNQATAYAARHLASASGG